MIPDSLAEPASLDKFQIFTTNKVRRGFLGRQQGKAGLTCGFTLPCSLDDDHAQMSTG
jgi:hypothetical protein